LVAIGVSNSSCQRFQPGSSSESGNDIPLSSPVLPRKYVASVALREVIVDSELQALMPSAESRTSLIWFPLLAGVEMVGEREREREREIEIERDRDR